VKPNLSGPVCQKQKRRKLSWSAQLGPDFQKKKKLKEKKKKGKMKSTAITINKKHK
jgi:hypothetical protein